MEVLLSSFFICGDRIGIEGCWEEEGVRMRFGLEGYCFYFIVCRIL